MMVVVVVVVVVVKRGKTHVRAPPRRSSDSGECLYSAPRISIPYKGLYSSG